MELPLTDRYAIIPLAFFIYLFYFVFFFCKLVRRQSVAWLKAISLRFLIHFGAGHKQTSKKDFIYIFSKCVKMAETNCWMIFYCNFS